MTESARIEIETGLVEKLIATQFPQWSGLPVRPVAEGGWNNRTFHLGPDMSVRLPSADRYVAQVEKEARWLPRLAPYLPLPVPEPLALGHPDETYPWPWSVYRWIEGETAKRERIADLVAFAEDLAGFLTALWAIDATPGPAAGPHNFHRGGSLRVYDAETRRALAILSDEIDTALITEIWETALGATFAGAPVWVHGDIAPGNMLVRQGRLSAVIDFGTCGTGDPSCDLAITWTLFDDDARRAFRTRLDRDAATWARARGWCLWKALITIADCRDTDAVKADIHRGWIARLSADHRDPV